MDVNLKPPDPFTRLTTAAFRSIAMVFGRPVPPTYEAVRETIARSDKVLAEARQAIAAYDASVQALEKTMKRVDHLLARK